MSVGKEIHLDRPITLHMQGDWGQANLHRICGWISQEVGKRVPVGSRFAIWNGRGGTDAMTALLKREVDLALFVPAGFAATAIEGKGLYKRPGMQQLRALATLPQDDRLVIAVGEELGVRSLDDIRRKRPELRVAIAPDDGVNTVGYASHRLLEAARMPRPDIERWGGSFLEGEAPWDVIPLATDGTVNAVIFEAIMTKYWRELLASRRMTFIPIEDEVLGALEGRFGWRRGSVSADRFAGQDEPFETLDFSDFLLMVREDMAEDLAYLITCCLCETRDAIERQYRHFTPQDSPLSYPLEPNKMAVTSIPLHDGAARYYRESNILQPAA